MARCHGKILLGQACLQEKSYYEAQDGKTNLIRTACYREKSKKKARKEHQKNIEILKSTYLILKTITIGANTTGIIEKSQE